MTNAQRKARLARITSISVFVVGVSASLAANVVASDHTPLGVATGLWAPLAFLLSMALIENIPVKGRAGQARLMGMAFLTLIAGWTSYCHLVEVFTAGGADLLTAHALPLTVDVMIAFATPGMRKRPVAAPRKRPVAKNVTSITRAKKAA